MKKRTSTNTKKGVVDDDGQDHSNCLACMGRHRPHTCTGTTRASRKRKKAAQKLQAESSVSGPSLQSNEQQANKNEKPKANQAVGNAETKPSRTRQQEPRQATGATTREIEATLSEFCEASMSSKTGGGFFGIPPIAEIHVHPTLTEATMEAAVAAVPPESAQATTADSMTSQRLINLLWDDLLVLPLESTPENDT